MRVREIGVTEGFRAETREVNHFHVQIFLVSRYAELELAARAGGKHFLRTGFNGLI
jgi:hypothetical protein